MNLRFERKQGAPRTIDGVRSLYLARSELKEGAQGRLLARHMEHHWNVNGEEYLRLDCDARLQIVFLDKHGSVRLVAGPFSHFSSIDGIAFGDHEVLAHFDTGRQVWYVLNQEVEWPILAVEPVAE